MLNTLKKMIDPTPPAAVTIEALEARVVTAQSKVDANRAAVKTAALAATQDPAAADAFAEAKRAHLASLGELDALDELRVLYQKSLDAESVVKKTAHDARVRETEEACRIAARALHAGAVKYAKLHKAYMAARIANGDALSVSGTAQRQRSMISMDSVLGRAKLDLLTLGVTGACRIPIDVNKVRPFLEVVEEELAYFTSQAVAGPSAGDSPPVEVRPENQE